MSHNSSTKIWDYLRLYTFKIIIETYHSCSLKASWWSQNNHIQEAGQAGSPALSGYLTSAGCPEPQYSSFDWLWPPRNIYSASSAASGHQYPGDVTASRALQSCQYFLHLSNHEFLYLHLIMLNFTLVSNY